MKNTRNILIISKGFPPDLGGVETYSLEIARAYKAAGHKVTVVTQFTGRPGWTTIEDINVYNTSPAPQLLQLIRFTRAIRNANTTFGPFDLVHTTTWRTAIPLLFNKLRPPLVITVHGREISAQRFPFTSLAQRILAHANRIIIISKEAQRRCSKVAPILATERTFVSWNGIGALKLAPLQERNTLNILIACRLIPLKNIENALEAAALAQAEHINPHFTLTIAGDGPLRKSLETKAKKLKLQDVNFLGQVPRKDMPGLYQSADIFLHPQVTIDKGRGFESFCLAVADAMAYGVPVIAGRDGAPREYIEHGVSGMIVNGRDPTDICAAITMLLSSKAIRNSIGTAASAFARSNFNWKKHITPALALLDTHAQ